MSGDEQVSVSLDLEIRPDTVFIAYHWAGDKTANLLTNPALDPGSKIPEYKVCTVRIERLGAGATPRDIRDTRLSGDGRPT